MPCELLDGFSLYVQVGLGVGSFSSLVYKRHRERPQRKLTIWVFDTSKQALSAGLVHLLNMVIAEVAVIAAGGDYDPCVVYLVNLVFDVAVGTVLTYWLLRLSESALVGVADVCCCPHALRNCAATGFYGSPPSAARWAGQLWIWVCVVCLSKAVCAMFTLKAPWLMAAGALLLSPLAPFPRIELVVVMLLAPLVLNIAQLWIQDNFLKLGQRQATGDIYAPLYRCPVVEMHGTVDGVDVDLIPAATLHATRTASAGLSGGSSEEAVALSQPPTAWDEEPVSRPPQPASLSL